MKKGMFALLFGFFSIYSFSQEKPEGLFINSKAPDFKGKDQNGVELNLKDQRKQGPVVLVFYRGYWSPYCNKYLKTLQDSLEQIKAKAAQVIAVTPEADSGVTKTIQKTNVAFSIITDGDMKIMKAYDVLYKMDDKEVSRLKISNIDVAVNNNQKPDAVFLPVPAVYIIGKDGEIKYRFFDADYKKRASVKDILDNLNGLK